MVSIIKASGDIVPYEEGKLRQSLLRIGVDEKLITKVAREVSHELVENMTTHQIYRIAFKVLRKESKCLAAKYHLKKAIMLLGTSGYPFEKYVGELIRCKNFHVKNNQYLRGHCVNHEVDVVAKRNDKLVIVECKYHNRSNLKCDVKVALYFKARVDNLVKRISKSSPDHIEGWLVTNTRFTSDALQYGVCAGLHMISWNDPAHGSLKENVNKFASQILAM